MTREESIERIKTRFDKWALDDEDMKAIQTLIPELQESEDERIRKWIIEVINEVKTDDDWCASPERCDKALAWLEKQKEHDSVGWNEDGRIMEEIIETLQHVKDNRNGIPKIHYSDEIIDKHITWLTRKKELESRIELKYRMNGLMQEYIEEGKDEAEREHRMKCYQLFWNALEDADYFEQKKKSVEWSEEDEKIYKVVLELLNSWSNGTIGCCIIPPNTDRYINWFKSLPERFNLQSNQEWNEEDEEKLKQIGIAIGSYYDLNHAPQFYYWLECRLKSLRPQPHWKPSEEQMQALDNTRFCKSYDRSELDSLYDDLKKL